ncbi:hypothetical protein [Paludisphaera borealis]|uniref:hypothetical protein n=1 Tax=Paludisphaera borealis TaxID=1387353 RepID=UPI0011AB4DAE|nr:hypothetical protein [Paludisphaera borealis]
MLSFADGNGAVVTGLVEPIDRGRSSIVISFDGPLNPTQAVDPSYYRVNALAPGNIEVVTKPGAVDPIRSVRYDAATQQVTLNLAHPLATGQCYRVWVDGNPTTGLTDASGTTIDGDADDTAAGDFYGLVAAGKRLTFNDMNGNRATVAVSGGGLVELWRGLNGNVNQLTIVGATANSTTLTGSIRPAKGSDGQVVIPSIQGLDGVDNLLPASFVTQATPIQSPTPVVATPQNLPYTLQIQAVAMPDAPTIQAAVHAESNGLWLIFGGRTNGMHSFDPSGLVSFPPIYQNNTIYVINPATGQVWSKDWSATGLPASATASLASSNQEFYQSGDRLYTVGGYSYDSSTGQFVTYDTLSAISVSGLIDAVVNNGDVAAQVKQISDPRLAVTGGDMNAINGRTFLVFGHDFQGGYNGGGAELSQVYTDEVRSFRIVDKGRSLSIAYYQAQRDPVNFRRRDGNLGAVVFPNGRPGLASYGGVFTRAGGGYLNPITIGTGGTARVDTQYDQFFSQYTAPNIPLFDGRDGSMTTIFLGGISLYDYNFSTGKLTSDPELPFVDDVTSLVKSADGSFQEFIMPSQLPGLLGAEAAYFQSPGLPTYSNGVIKLDQLSGPTTLGYIYGGIVSSVPNTTTPAGQTTASNRVFKVTLTPVV